MHKIPTLQYKVYTTCNISYIYIYIYIYLLYIYIYICVCVYIYLYIYTYVCISNYIYLSIYLCMYTTFILHILSNFLARQLPLVQFCYCVWVWTGNIKYIVPGMNDKLSYFFSKICCHQENIHLKCGILRQEWPL